MGSTAAPVRVFFSSAAAPALAAASATVWTSVAVCARRPMSTATTVSARNAARDTAAATKTCPCSFFTSEDPLHRELFTAENLDGVPGSDVLARVRCRAYRPAVPAEQRVRRDTGRPNDVLV